MLFDQDRWPLSRALAWVLTRDREYFERAEVSSFSPRLSDPNWKSADHTDQAWDQLQAKIAVGEVAAFHRDGSKLHSLSSAQIAWLPVSGVSENFLAQNIQASASDVLKSFPPEDEPITFGSQHIGSPERPSGAGFMSFADAVYWIATEGGSRKFWARESHIWECAVRALVDEISSDLVRLIGRRSAMKLPEAIPGYSVSGLQFLLPAQPLSLESIMSDEPYLDVTLPSLGEDWLSMTDSIYSSREKMWSHLQVSREDVRARWPFTHSTYSAKIAPIRERSSKYKIIEEVDALVVAKPNASTRDADALAVRIGAPRDVVREQLDVVRAKLGKQKKLGRPPK